MLAFEQDILGSDFQSPEGAGYLIMWIPDNIGGGGSQKSSAGYWKIRVFHKLWPSLSV